MTLYTPHNRRIRPILDGIQLRVCRYVISGYTADQTAAELGISSWTVKDHLKRARYWLMENGYPDVKNVIKLRTALRDEGLIDDIGMI